MDVLKLITCLLVYFCCVNSEYISLPEGSECTWDDLKGTCEHIYRCLSAKNNIFKHNQRPPICEYQGKQPVICCTDCSLVNDTRLIIFNKYVGFLYKDGRKAHDKCFDYINELVNPCLDTVTGGYHWIFEKEKKCNRLNPWWVSPSGGKPARRNEYPHMALLGYGSDVLSMQWLCGGSLISHNFILTAGHCISTPVLGPVTYVALGILKRSDPPELWQKYKVKSIIPHPDYKSPSKYHDIALLETSTPVLFGDVRPACLHVDGDLDEDLYEEAIATGWGSTGKRKDLTDTLLTVKLKKFTDEECMVNYPPHRHLQNGFNRTTQICYGDRDGIQDTCEGDSGGPLQIKRQRPYCSFMILGVTSYGKACEAVGNSGMYTKVQYYVPWIESVVWP